MILVAIVEETYEDQTSYIIRWSMPFFEKELTSPRPTQNCNIQQIY